MIVVFKPNTKEEETQKVREFIESKNLKIDVSVGKGQILFGCTGETRSVNEEQINLFDCVEKVMRVQTPYKRVNRLFSPEDTVVSVRGQKIGGGNFAIIAGPCAVESREQYLAIAKGVAEGGANFLRGGAFKPRTSPYAFQGLGRKGIEIMKEARELTGLPIISEMMTINQIEEFGKEVDIIQIGARNMQNFDLLKAAGRSNTPVLLKRGLSATYEELLMAAEYIMSEGNKDVIFCERGIRTHETFTRNTLDVSAVPVIKEKSHLPIVIDPSHSGGKNWLVSPLSKAAVAIGADGLTMEVHNNPKEALCDGQQSLEIEEFKKLVQDIKKLREVVKGYVG